MRSGDFISVKGVAYQPPKQATRESAYLAMFPVPETLVGGEEALAPAQKRKRSLMARRAKGEVDVDVVGQVCSISGDLVTYRKAGTEEREIALAENCTVIRICDICLKREAVGHDKHGHYCDSKSCKRKTRTKA